LVGWAGSCSFLTDSCKFPTEKKDYGHSEFQFCSYSIPKSGFSATDVVFLEEKLQQDWFRSSSLIQRDWFLLGCVEREHVSAAT